MLVVLMLCLVTPSLVSAVQVDFDNCLEPNYKDGNNLQFMPLIADATYVIDGEKRTFFYQAWSNVTGWVGGKPPNGGHLPPDYWENTSMTEGKIANGKKNPTVFDSIDLLMTRVWNDTLSFCDTGIHTDCPVGPVFNHTEVDLRKALPSFNFTHDFSGSIAFNSFATTILVKPGYDNIVVGCVSSVITPDLGPTAAAVQFVPLAALLVTGFAVIFAGMYSPWGSTDIFQWTTNYGRDADQLRLITPGFGDFLQYLQFIVLTGGLSISYPGFYQPVVSNIAWASVMFNESVVTHKPGWQSVQDGIYAYVPNTRYGLHRLGQLVGMQDATDIWAGMMVWLCVVVLGVFVIVQLGFLAQWLYRRVKQVPEEDLRSKNIPFSVGNIVRIVFNFLLLPIVALSTFQLLLASESPRFTVALAAVTLAVLVGLAVYVLYFIVATKPKAVLFDDLPTVLRLGPLYNTYSDEAAAFALVPIILTFLRGIAIGGFQFSGITQVVMLAICEVIYVFSLHAFRPFQTHTSMNAYHTAFGIMRLLGVLLLIPFIPSLGLTEGPKGWIGYAALIVHACVIFFGFFLSALQTIVEVAARLLGAGGDNASGLKRGGLSKIFGMRQLAKREVHRPAPSRASQLSTSAIVNPSRTAYSPGLGVRSSSGLSIGLSPRNVKRSSSALDSPDVYSTHRTMDSPTSYVPGTPAEDSTYSFVNTPSTNRPGISLAALKAADPWYRPPRRGTQTAGDNLLADQQRVSLIMDKHDSSLPASRGLGLDPENGDIGAEISRNGTPIAPGTLGVNPAISYPPNQPDYATREVDFYYGVRGPALNSDHLGRKLGTGPADPTGPIATASSWVRGLFGGKSKDKSKGFEVVRSSRMPKAVANNGGYGDETPPEGIPIATGGIRTGPIESDDDEPVPQKSSHRPAPIVTNFETPEDESDGPPPISPLTDDAPDIPRKSSKRDSHLAPRGHTPTLSLVESNSQDDRSSRDEAAIYGHKKSLSASHAAAPALPTLPFERSASKKQRSPRGSTDMLGEQDEFTNIDLATLSSDRPASFGVVRQHGISRVDPVHHGADWAGSSAELVDENGTIKRK